MLSPLSPDADLEQMLLAAGGPGAFEAGTDHGRHGESGIGSGADSVGGGTIMHAQQQQQQPGQHHAQQHGHFGGVAGYLSAAATSLRIRKKVRDDGKTW